MASPRSKRGKLRGRDLYACVFNIRSLVLQDIPRDIPKGRCTKDLSIQYLLQYSCQQLIYHICRWNSLEERTRFKLGIRSIPVFTKNELRRWYTFNTWNYDGWDIRCVSCQFRKNALKIPNQRNILNILRSIIVKCEAENRLRSFFLFLFFFVSIMK